MFDDLMKYKEKFGATAGDLGIDEDFMFSFKTKGRLFDHDCDCYLEFDADKVFTGYTVYVYGVRGGDIPEKLNDYCCGPASSSMTPYAASNGGAVYSVVYEDRDALISVSMAQNNGYFSVKFKPNPDPGYFGPLTLRPAAFKGFFPENVDADPAGYENGILTVRIVNHGETPFELCDDFALFERRESSYYSKFRTVPSFIPANSCTAPAKGSLDMKLDLRSFGRPVPNEYMVRFSGIELYFVLEGERPLSPGTE